ncbi:hypothetical protein BH11MYX1_BH11MYX1_27430 [soil metagenome]
MVEFCEGEVADVLDLVHVTLARPFADPARAGMIGFSHGGCITLRAAELELGVPVQAIVDFFGPTDLALEFAHLQERSATSTGDPKAIFDALVALSIRATGGTPAQVPDQYATRSPFSRLSKLNAFPGAILIVHGNDDPIVPPSQACIVARQMAITESYHVDASQHVTATEPADCAGLTWQAGAAPQAEWSASRYLLVFDGMGHEGSSAAAVVAQWQAARFLTAKVPENP